MRHIRRGNEEYVVGESEPGTMVHQGKSGTTRQRVKVMESNAPVL